MPNWPPADGQRTITIELPVGHIQHLDAQARHRGCSRAAYVRLLIRLDMDAAQAQRA